ncbi:hypothetical protein CHUAL_009718 [Chamberlinius hualienensis]
MGAADKTLFFYTSMILLAKIVLCQNNGSFVIDYDNNQFLMDGKPFRYISGSIHYFRVPREHWQNRFDLMKAAGLNAIQTYVIWNEHEPQPGVYNFNERFDLIGFIQLAQQNGLYVILRAGPYICAEVDMGGIPSWLLSAYPNMTLRTSDIFYMEFVNRWFDVLLPMIRPFLYQNGGPIITVQVENEYGSYYACDFTYMEYLRDLFRFYLGNEVVLFTTDGNSGSFLKCGKVKGLYATIDFSPGENVNKSFEALRVYEPKGPLINSEYYTYGHVHWGFPQYDLILSDVSITLEEMLDLNASVNMYMFHGGTNFGFSSGANSHGTYDYLADTTSYDFMAPISESGLVSDLYYTIRDTIQKYSPDPLPPIPPPLTMAAYGQVQLQYVGSLFELVPLLVTTPTISSELPLTFEELQQAYGFVLYETVIPNTFMDPSSLSVPEIRDRGYVFIDQKYVGLLSRTGSLTTLSITVKSGQLLSILVENQGRLNYGNSLNDFKGLLSAPKLDDVLLKEWKMTQLPFSNVKHVEKVISTMKNRKFTALNQVLFPTKTPGIFTGNFVINDSQTYDTFLKLPDGWGKGIVFFNGFNLGRYWPAMGPQVTLYVPKGLLRVYPAQNEISLVELQESPCTMPNRKQHRASNYSFSSNCYIEFVDYLILNGTTPHG